MGLLNIVSMNGTFEKPKATPRPLVSGRAWAFLLGLSALLFAILPTTSFGQVYGTATNRITVKVQAITVLQIIGTIVNLNISGSNALAGQDQMMTTDQTSTLAWGTNSSLKKITANTSLAAPKFTLQLVAVNPTFGTAASQMTLSTTANDLLLNIGRSSGTCSLLYTAVALASQGTGTDAHTITFTVLTQ